MTTQKKDRLLAVETDFAEVEKAEGTPVAMTSDTAAAYGLAPASDIDSPDSSQQEWELFSANVTDALKRRERPKTFTYDIESDIVETFKILDIKGATRSLLINACLRAFLLHHKERLLPFVTHRATVF